MTKPVMPAIWVKTTPVRILAGILAVTAAIVGWVWPQLPQKDYAWYFDFADKSQIFGIEHSMDVLSNLGFLVSSLFGLYWLVKYRPFQARTQKVLMAAFAVSGIFIAFGSTYFHLDPNEIRLFWDRLPMAISFAFLIALLIGDRIDSRLGAWVALGLVPLAIETVVGWSDGWLSLRPYHMLQHGGMVFLLLLAIFRPRGEIPNKAIFGGLGLYVLAKVFELLDGPVFATNGLVSGHTIKHLVAALALLKLMSFMRRENI